jgi:hypothetical protein
MVVDSRRHAPAALPQGKTRCLLYRGLGSPQDRSGRVRKTSPAPGFDPRTVQPVASSYTHCAIPAHMLSLLGLCFNMRQGGGHKYVVHNDR